MEGSLVEERKPLWMALWKKGLLGHLGPLCLALGTNLYGWLYGRKPCDRVRSLPGPLRNIFLFTAIYSLLSSQAYLGYKIRKCE